MVDYILSEAAREDLKNIYRYGYERFGERQAEHYYDGLIGCFAKIAKSPFQFQKVPEVGNDYRRFVYISESIYYRVKNNRLEIMAIIGRQDISNRL
ncbi:MAG: type II toxin-antitoxin system RelE/ParE family toxin [Flavobacteriales bacterium]|nr:type II toxin-antitoxin system RelE/ParE family toxin [Flavobacteriales bacterium]